MNPNNDISDFKKFALELFSDYFLGVLDLEILKEEFIFELDFDAGPETIKFIVATYDEIKKNSNLIENMFTELGLKQITQIDCMQILAIKYSEEILYKPDLAAYLSGEVFYKYNPLSIDKDIKAETSGPQIITEPLTLIALTLLTGKMESAMKIMIMS